MTWFMESLKIQLEEKLLCDKAFNSAKNLKYGVYQHGLASVAYKCFDKKTSVICAQSEILATQIKFAGIGFKNENISNKELAVKNH